MIPLVYTYEYLYCFERLESVLHPVDGRVGRFLSERRGSLVLLGGAEGSHCRGLTRVPLLLRRDVLQKR